VVTGIMVYTSIAYPHSFPLNQYIDARTTNPPMEMINNGTYCQFFRARIPAFSINASPIKIIIVISILFLVSPENQSDAGIYPVLGMLGMP
jgi:hypothetical protein